MKPNLADLALKIQNCPDIASAEEMLREFRRQCLDEAKQIIDKRRGDTTLSWKEARSSDFKSYWAGAADTATQFSMEIGQLKGE